MLCKRSSKVSQQQYALKAITEDKTRSRKSTENRILTVFKAILNKAYQNEMIDEDLAWRRVRSMGQESSR